MAPTRKNKDGEKQQRKAIYMAKVLRGNKATRAQSFKKRNPTLKKKAVELQSLIGAPVAMVCFGPNGDVYTWPEQESELRALITAYKEFDVKGKCEHNLMSFLEKQKKKSEETSYKDVMKKLDEKKVSFSKWFDGLPNAYASSFLESKIMVLKEKLYRLIMGEPDKVTCDDNLKIYFGLLDTQEKLCRSHNKGALIGTCGIPNNLQVSSSVHQQAFSLQE